MCGLELFSLLSCLLTFALSTFKKESPGMKTTYFSDLK